MDRARRVASNVPGISVPLYLTGAKVDSFFGFGPTTGAALNVTLMSYNGTCCVGITLDPAAIEEPNLFAACLCESFDEVVGDRGATVLVANPE